MKNRKCFEKRNVVIIGATGGLGSAYTQMFLQEGATVYLGARSTDKLKTQYASCPEKVHIGYIDITQPNSIEQFVQQVQSQIGNVDYVINATGHDVRKDLQAHSIEDITESIAINLSGCIFLTKTFLSILKEQSESTIVHMGGFIDGGLAFPYYSVDVSTRGSIYAFCESMNRELMQEGHRYHLTYFCPNPANTKAELPFFPIWKEMKCKISTVDEVALALKKTILSRKKVSIMGGGLQSGFAKLNHISTALSNLLMMNSYSGILQKYLASNPEKKTTIIESKHKRYSWLAVGLIILSFILYLPVPVLPCLSITVCMKLFLFVLINILSWGIFFIGSLLGGKEVWNYLKHMTKK